MSNNTPKLPKLIRQDTDQVKVTAVMVKLVAAAESLHTIHTTLIPTTDLEFIEILNVNIRRHMANNNYDGSDLDNIIFACDCAAEMSSCTTTRPYFKQLGTTIKRACALPESMLSLATAIQQGQVHVVQQGNHSTNCFSFSG